MNLVLAVVEDLYVFAHTALLGARRNAGTVSTLMLNPSREVVATKEGPSAEYDVENTTDSHASEAIEMPEAAAYAERPTPQKNTVMYISSMYATLRSEPTILRDTNLGTIPYGAMVMVLEAKNGWAKILKGTDEGWIETRDLADRAAYILPQFKKDEPNNEDDPNTIRLRAIINDEFSCGAAGLPLQAHEYVLYKLIRKNVSLKWPKIRPRTPGRWAEVLSHAQNVTLSVEPLSGSVMEFFTKDSIGRLVFVEAVFPDGALQISEVNWPDEGIYNERVVKKEDWSSYNPVFINIT